MGAILLIAGLFFFWIWLHGHPIGAVVAFLLVIFTGAPAILGVDNLPMYLGYSAALALSPMAILWLYRDLKKGRDSRLAHFGAAVLDSLAPPKAREPDVAWSKEDLEAWARAPSGQPYERPIEVRLRQPGG
jgi:hypothetical protein